MVDLLDVRKLRWFPGLSQPWTIGLVPWERANVGFAEYCSEMPMSGTEGSISQYGRHPADALGIAVAKARAKIALPATRLELEERGWKGFSNRYEPMAVGYTKYLDLDRYLLRDLQRSYRLARLLRMRPSGSVIDLGSGMGLFPYCCERLGLRCLGVEPTQPDWDYTTMFADSAALLGISTLNHLIKPFEPIPIPDDWAPISAVTANQIQFNKIGSGDDAPEVLPSERFGAEEWDYLLRDIYSRSDRDHIVVHLSFNRPRTWNASYTDEVRRYFEGLGGRCRGSVVQILELRF